MFVIMSAAIKISFCFLDLLILAWGMKELYKKLIISNASEKRKSKLQMELLYRF